MQSTNKDIRYIPIDETNVLLATSIQLEIFPDMCGYGSFVKAMQCGDPYFIVYLDDTPIGTTGLYTDPDISDSGTIWLGWYGILAPYRGRGIGKTVLLDTIAEAVSRGYTTFRLYTSALLCEAACKLYDSVMDIGEEYTLEERHLQRRVYSKSLTGGKADAWHDRPLRLDKAREEEQASYAEYLRLSAAQQK